MGKNLVQTVVFGAVFWLIKNMILGDFTGNISIIISVGLGGLWGVIFVLLNFKKLLSNWKQLNSYKTAVSDEENNEGVAD